MKIKAVILSSLVCVIFLSVGHENTWAAKTKKTSLKIGVVSVRNVFKDCKKIVKYRQQTMAERDKLVAELDKLSKEIEAERAGLRTLKEGSGDYMNRIKTIMEKQARLQAQEEFHKQQMMLKERRITEELYKEILLQTRKVAEQKGLDLVFEKSEPDLPSASKNDLMLTISTHKLLYSSGCVDITAEVIAALDAGN